MYFLAKQCFFSSEQQLVGFLGIVESCGSEGCYAATAALILRSHDQEIADLISQAPSKRLALTCLEITFLVV